MVYFISGLGADERIFKFLDLGPIEHRHIKWIPPFRNEALGDYCKRLVEQIDLNETVVLIGVSFGGIIAQEISKLIGVERVVIISSIKKSSEFSMPFRMLRKLQIHNLVPYWLMKIGNKYTADYYFGTQTQEESKLLHQIIDDTDPHFLAWAIDRIMNWKNDSYPSNLVHIQGTTDRIFPIRNIENAIEIANGGHFMTVNKSQEVERLIFALINSTVNEYTE